MVELSNGIQALLGIFQANLGLLVVAQLILVLNEVAHLVFLSDFEFDVRHIQVGKGLTRLGLRCLLPSLVEVQLNLVVLGAFKGPCVLRQFRVLLKAV